MMLEISETFLFISTSNIFSSVFTNGLSLDAGTWLNSKGRMPLVNLEVWLLYSSFCLLLGSGAALGFPPRESYVVLKFS
jgi:hypothetical protein